ncbi:hypothetical protein Pmani_033579 [Petrolisthes manimaculis]|uniref:Uncharacterized protein n=1 Tax=Petrolisthes manimaculis TaxID=1843537 RepID=A0AAE1NQR3_9EUCA|nr:hypothetical protein Pmani_033579 [Petrolisthes manimaculis]
MKAAVTQLRSAGERLGKYEIEKRHAIESENYDRAKVKKEQAEEYREAVYTTLNIDDLLERKGKLDKNDLPGGSTLQTLPPPLTPQEPPTTTPHSPPLQITVAAAVATVAPPPPHPPSIPSFLPPARYPNTPPKPPPSPPRSPSHLRSALRPHHCLTYVPDP